MKEIDFHQEEVDSQMITLEEDKMIIEEMKDEIILGVEEMNMMIDFETNLFQIYEDKKCNWPDLETY